MGSGGSVNSEKNRQNYTIQNTRNVGKSISRETIVPIEKKSVTKEEDLNENVNLKDLSKTRDNSELAEVKPKQNPEWYLAWISDDLYSNISQSDCEDNLRFGQASIEELKK